MANSQLLKILTDIENQFKLEKEAFKLKTKSYTSTWMENDKNYLLDIKLISENVRKMQSIISEFYNISIIDIQFLRRYLSGDKNLEAFQDLLVFEQSILDRGQKVEKSLHDIALKLKHHLVAKGIWAVLEAKRSEKGLDFVPILSCWPYPLSCPQIHKSLTYVKNELRKSQK